MMKRPAYGVHSLQGNTGKRKDGGNASKNVGELVQVEPQQGIRHIQVSINRYVLRNR